MVNRRVYSDVDAGIDADGRERIGPATVALTLNLFWNPFCLPQNKTKQYHTSYIMYLVLWDLINQEAPYLQSILV